MARVWLLALLGAMFVLLIVAYSLVASGFEAQSVSELAMVVAVGCICFCVLAQHATRRWFQYSLRTLLVGILLAGIGMSWLAVKLERARRQGQAVEAIKRTGASVEYDYHWSRGRPGDAAWRRQLFENDLFATVLRVTAQSDEALEHIGVLAQIQQVYLEGSQISDKSLERLKGLTELEHLLLTNTNVTDAGLVHLQGLPKLRSLMVLGARVSDAGLEHLGGLPQLESLHLDGTQVTDAGLEHLEGATRLQLLSLGGTGITDAGLEHLKGLSRLQVLILQGTKVSDAGVEHLQGLTQLRSLDVRRTLVTDVGVKKLERALLECKIAK